MYHKHNIVNRSFTVTSPHKEFARNIMIIYILKKANPLSGNLAQINGYLSLSRISDEIIFNLSM